VEIQTKTKPSKPLLLPRCRKQEIKCLLKNRTLTSKRSKVNNNNPRSKEVSSNPQKLMVKARRRKRETEIRTKIKMQSE